MTYRNWIENWIERKSPLVKESTAYLFLTARIRNV